MLTIPMFNGEHRGFYKWKNAYCGALRSKGIMHTIGNISKAPTRPVANFLVPEADRTTNDNSLIHQFETKQRIYEIECETALGILQQSVGPDLLGRFDDIINSLDFTPRQMIKQVFDGICLLYAHDTTHLVINVENEIHDVPNASTMKEVLSIINKMINTNNELKSIPKTLTVQEEAEFVVLTQTAVANNRPAPIRPTCKLEDRDLKKILNRKLTGAEFYNILDKFETKTFLEICDIIRLNASRSSLNEAFLQQRSSSSSIMAVTQSMLSDKVDTALMQVSKVPFGLFKKPCWNCKAYGHYPRDCTTLACRNCKQFWDSTSEKGFHRSSDCHLRINSKKRKDSDIESPLKISKKEEVNSVFVDQNHNTEDIIILPENENLWDQWYADNAINLDLELPENAVDALDSTNSNQVYFSFQISSLIHINSTNGIYVNTDLALLDSGASLSVSHPSVAKKFNFPVYKSQSKFNMEFANLSSTTSNYYYYYYLWTCVG